MVVTGPVCSWGVATTFRVSNSQTTISPVDRKSTRLNSSHLGISYAVFCLKKKKNRLVLHPAARTHDNIRDRETIVSDNGKHQANHGDIIGSHIVTLRVHRAIEAHAYHRVG